MVKQSRAEWKGSYFKKLGKNLLECERCFIVNVDNVRSKQMQQIRIALRGSAEIVLGKNTLMKKVIQTQLYRNKKLEKIIPHIKENVGFVFTKNDLSEIRQKLGENRVKAPAKAGVIAPCDVMIPAQNTGLGPEKTSFFQALCIPTKISRGAIEIINDVHIVKKDTKVGMSEAALLGMLKIHPFSYGLVITQVYDNGSVYDPSVLDMTSDMIIDKFITHASNLIAISLAVGYTTVVSVPHLIANGFKNLLSISAVTDYTFKESEQIKAFLSDPSKFIVAAAPVKSTNEKSDEPKPAVAAQPESESDDDFNLDLFG